MMKFDLSNHLPLVGRSANEVSRVGGTSAHCSPPTRFAIATLWQSDLPTRGR
jgi:hypothetical protein